MSTEDNLSVVRTVIEEGFNKGNYHVLDALFATDYTEHQFGLKPTLEGFKADIAFLRQAFPDFHLNIEEAVCDGDTVWVRMTAQGTNSGPFMGPPTGKRILATVFDMLRLENGQIKEHWGVPDRFAILAQLGRLPEPG